MQTIAHLWDMQTNKKMDTIKIKTAIMNHLNDALIELGAENEQLRLIGYTRIRFVKSLIFRHMPSIEINMEDAWNEFIANDTLHQK